MSSHRCQSVEIASVGIVGHAIFPNQTDVLGSLVYGLVLSLVEFLLHEAKIHRFFYDAGIVEQTQGLPVDWRSEWLLGADEVRQYGRGRGRKRKKKARFRDVMVMVSSRGDEKKN